MRKWSKRRLLVLALVSGAALVATFLALLLRSGGSSLAQVQGRRPALVPSTKRKTLPDLDGPTLTPPPNKLRLRTLKGRPLFVDVWASWCVPCRQEAPLLARLWREHRGEIRFLGIDVEDSRSDARAFVRRYRLGYPSIFDRKAALAGKLGFSGLPTAYLVDPRGRVAATLIGKQEEATLRTLLAALAAETKH